MNREYHRWWSGGLGRDMEMLVFGHGGAPAVVFPTSCGRFYEFEDRGMVEALGEQLESGRLQLFCVDSVDGESWYNRGVAPDGRIARQVQYENYILRDVLPLARQKNGGQEFVSVGCSFGGFHALNIALRHPKLFPRCLSMSGAFDLRKLGFLKGMYGAECDLHLPLDYVTGMRDGDLLEQVRRGSFVFATGVQDQCRDDNERMAAAMLEKGIPVRLEVWGDDAGHDWPWWRRMAQAYL